MRRDCFLEGQFLGGGARAGPSEAPALRVPVMQVDKAVVDLYRRVGEVIE